jgi:hypothetical protein
MNLYSLVACPLKFPARYTGRIGQTVEILHPGTQNVILPNANAPLRSVLRLARAESVCADKRLSLGDKLLIPSSD